MLTKEFERFLAQFSGNAGEVDQRVRFLRDIDVLSTVRGRYAPDINPEQMAAMILSLVSRRASDAAKVTPEAMKLRIVGREGVPSDLVGKSLHECLAGFITDPAAAEYVGAVRFEIAETGKIARLIFRDGTTALFTNDAHIRESVSSSAELYSAAALDGCYRLLVIGIGFLKAAATELAEANEEGEIIA